MKDSDAAKICKALSYPLRIELLTAMRECEVLSPSQYSRDTGEPLGNVSYHVKALVHEVALLT